MYDHLGSFYSRARSTRQLFPQGSSRRSEIQFIYISPSPQLHHFILAKLLRFQRTFLEKSFVSGFGADSPNLLFFRRKVGKRTSPRLHHFILAKLLRFQRTFLEKSFVSGFGAEAPTFNAHKKTRISPRFLFFRNMLELPFQTLL